ncbi:Sigma-24 [Weeksella virosa]|uniref:RNA polymerase sigma factor n=1 Tax=Weeksella virosa TaxID=1014 RepID=UPI000E03BC31|nr:sigma-70 family RNA polymerase sigma factor [Weeksella virosa]SUP54682.1 Sigma-24 [Weeksella virosa]
MNLVEVIAEAKKGKNVAQNTLMDTFWLPVYRYVEGKIRNDEEAEDITIETFTKAFNKLKLYNPDFDFLTWLISIAHNTMIDYIRRSPKLNISLDDEAFSQHQYIVEENPTPEEYLILQQKNDELLAEIEKLPIHYQKVIQLRYLEDKTYKEIAEELQLTLANVKVRILRARQLLWEQLR